MQVRAWASIAVGVIVVGCSSTATTTTNGASPDGGASPSGTSDAGSTSGGLSCLDVLKCAGACPDTNADACVQGCLDQTSKSSQPITSALVKCIDDNKCADATCIQTKCETELSNCLSDVKEVEGKPTSGPPPSGSVPADLVGVWAQVGLSTGSSYQFEADGTTIQAFSSETNYGCESKIEVSSNGITTVSGDSLVYHREKGTQGIKTCGTPKATTLGPADIAYRYVLGKDPDGAPKLSLYRINEDGTESSALDLHH